MYEITFLITIKLQQWWLIPLPPAIPAFPKTKTKEYSPGWGCGGEWCRMIVIQINFSTQLLSITAAIDAVSMCINSNACDK